MNRSRAIGIIGTGVLAFALVIAAIDAAALRWNATGSYPKGLWRTASSDWRKGDLVFVDPPAHSPIFAAALLRGYLRRAYTGSGCAPLLKRVVAVTGDRVDIDGAVAVNGTTLPNSNVRRRDSAGRPLAVVDLHRHLAPGEILVMSEYNQASFDSRYFGPLSATQVRGRAVPVLTW